MHSKRIKKKHIFRFINNLKPYNVVVTHEKKFYLMNHKGDKKQPYYRIETAYNLQEQIMYRLVTEHPKLPNDNTKVKEGKITSFRAYRFDKNTNLSFTQTDYYRSDSLSVNSYQDFKYDDKNRLTKYFTRTDSTVKWEIYVYIDYEDLITTQYENHKEQSYTITTRDKKLIEYVDHEHNWWNKEHMADTTCPFNKNKWELNKDIDPTPTPTLIT